MRDADDQDEKLAVRAVWYYYIEGHTQERIARQLGISRVKTTRLLAQARESGLVQFHINSRHADCVRLEQRLREAFGLVDAVVVPAAIDGDNLNEVIGQAAGDYLSEFFAEAMTVAIGWGRTLTYASRALHPRPLSESTVVSLLGGLTHPHGLNPMECAWQFANKLNAECYVLAAPAYAADAGLRDALLAQRELREVIGRAERADAAVISVGSLAPTAPITRYGFLERRHLDELKAAGAVGDILCYFIDGDGHIVDHSVNRRVCAFDPRSLGRIPNVILASGGTEKVPALYAALLLTEANVLITDELSASQLLERHEQRLRA